MNINDTDAQPMPREQDKLPFWMKRTPSGPNANETFVVYASDKKTLFCRAARTLFHHITDLSKVQDADKTQLAVQGPDLPSLMAAWLTELNALHSDRRILFKRFAILEMSNIYLKAEACGEDYDPARHVLRRAGQAALQSLPAVDYVNDQWIARLAL